MVIDFWALISAPALMDLEIMCGGLRFRDHSRTAPPAAVAALERGTLFACFRMIADYADTESPLQPEIAIMKSCGMSVQIGEEIGLLCKFGS